MDLQYFQKLEGGEKSILEKRIQQKFICPWETFFPDFSFINIPAKRFSSKWLKYTSNLISLELKPLSLF